ncbi:hypothetical protein F7734_02050 [Scytonema sp. UIC 10036]|uniref:hypothetical protein n=1 Tax=Scytonema sp. UIC 10036 TaxID=2304196 RepID=UPI0012DA68DC|nr:hypothetical protein [Scytonema sp. UIC 10036]MUG91333.1 hypothetical protein [Scytonema sp. UIC 10036]
MDFRTIAILPVLVGAAVIGLLGGAYLISRFWKDIRENVAAWLRKKGLQKSALMDAWVILDKLATGIKSSIFVKTRDTGTQQVSEQEYTEEELYDSDPNVYAEFQKRGYLKKNIMSLFQ